jgi:hypothetical protein
MKSGRELDAEVAERVMGWVWMKRVRQNNAWLFPPNSRDVNTGEEGLFGEPIITRNHTVGPFEEYDGLARKNESHVPRYSESIEAAVQAVEKMRERGYGWTICTHKDGWFVRCFELPDEGLEWRHSTVVKPTLTEAVCLSALAALEESKIAKEKCGLVG